MNFIFPQPIEVTFSLQQIRATINGMLMADKLHSYCSYKFQLVKNKYLYCKCQQCPARLIYKKQDDCYRLHKCYNNHTHKDKWVRRSKIIREIKQYPSCYSIKSIKNQILAKHKISTSTFYRCLRMAKCSGQTISEVLTQLQEEGIFGVTIHLTDQELPTITMLTNQSMIGQYYKCNKNVQFDLTYNLIRQKNENTQYSVGSFVALDNTFSIQPICLVIMQSETIDNFIRMFNEFFFLMKSSPNIIVTDQQKAVISALHNLKERGLFQGYHFFDVFHVLRNIKKQLQHKPSINFIVSLIRSTNIPQFNSRYQKCKEKLSSRDFNVLSQQRQILDLCCFALLPVDAFIGFSAVTNSCEKMNDLIKQRIPYSQKYCIVVYLVSRFFAKMSSKRTQCQNIENIRFEQYLGLPELETLRWKVCKKLFKKIMMELSLSLTCMISFDQDTESFQIREIDLEQNPFIVHFDQIQGKWFCTCNFSPKNGIPCCHQIKVLLFKKQSIITAIHSWWILQKNQINREEKKIPRPRKTRRNTH